jgi:ATP-binding cassette subfamily C (CFTR/MRP) protein 4
MFSISFALSVTRSIEIIKLLCHPNRIKNYFNIGNNSKTQKTNENSNIQPHLSNNITFKHVSFGYSSKNILNNVNLHIKSGEKICIIGRTGSGKSTLVSLLYRIECPTEGIVMLGDKDIREINISQLRNSISFISQNPFMFIGTLRENLDPFGEYTDEYMNHVLKITGLDKIFNLDIFIDVDSDNISFG